VVLKALWTESVRKKKMNGNCCMRRHEPLVLKEQKEGEVNEQNLASSGMKLSRWCRESAEFEVSSLSRDEIRSQLKTKLLV